jgi:hypothetical protein
MIEQLSKHLPRASMRFLFGLVFVISALAGVRAADLGIGAADPTVGSSPVVTEAPSSGTAADPAGDSTSLNGGGGKNIVKILNRRDGRLTVKGSIQYNGIPAPRVAPVNIASAIGSCVGCQTYAVALQIAVYERGASYVAPQNAAVAVNAGCTHCVTVARAIQYAIPVDDIQNVPSDIKKLVHDLDQRLHEIEGVYDTTTFSAFQADGKILAVIGSFQSLANDLLNESMIETASESPGQSASPTDSATESAAVGTNASSTEPSSEPSGSGATESPAQTCPTNPSSADPSGAPMGASPSDAVCPTDAPAASGVTNSTGP